jgi:4-hydroxy-4-methyl-2-oxoglutarate aldolase
MEWSEEEGECVSSRLLALDTCAISDALDRVGIAGVVDGLRMMWPCGRVGGRVITVRLVTGRPGAPTSSRHLGTTALEMARPGDVIVVDNGARTEVAGWGGLLSNGAVARGVAAVIVYGACRDVDETSALGLPLFAMNACPRTARGRIEEDLTGGPIELGSVTVNLGDLVLADQSGVVVVPQGMAAAVLDQAEAIAAHEIEMAAELRRGTPAHVVMSEKYEHMVDLNRPEKG